MPTATDLVDRQIAAFRARDTDAFLACYAKDAKIRDFDGNVMADGLEGLREFYGPIFRDSPQLSMQIPHRIAAGDYVIDEEQGSGLNAPGYPSTMHGIAVYRVRDDLIQDVLLLLT
jgi:uncharacterized protein (TIGR02246 family)